ncbi:hypothetical protein RDABS01_032111, partial [Bienertia sinuspersici]
KAVHEAFKDFYTALLGTDNEERILVREEAVKEGLIVTEEQAKYLTMEFTKEDIRKAFFSIPGNKASGLDGYNSTFFKEASDLIGDEVSQAVKDFFDTSKLLSDDNCTRLTLIPKVQHPQSVTELRLIAYCNTIYKFISKLMCMRLKAILPSITSHNQ